jgi:hypothetical protein
LAKPHGMKNLQKKIKKFREIMTPILIDEIKKLNAACEALSKEDKIRHVGGKSATRTRKSFHDLHANAIGFQNEKRT